MTIDELLEWSEAHAQVERARARMLYCAISAAVNGGKAFQAFDRMTSELR